MYDLEWSLDGLKWQVGRFIVLTEPYRTVSNVVYAVSVWKFILGFHRTKRSAKRQSIDIGNDLYILGKLFYLEPQILRVRVWENEK